MSGGITYATFKPGAETLRKHLRELPCSGIEPGTPDIEQSDIVADATHALADGAAQVGALAASGAAAAGDAVAARVAAAGDAATKARAAAVEGAAQLGSTLADGAANIGKFFGSFGKK